jgi:hypothetical protein
LKIEIQILDRAAERNLGVAGGFMRLRSIIVAGIWIAGFGAQAGDLTPEVATKFIKLISSTSGGKVFARDPAMKSALEAAGVSVDASAKVYWCTSPSEVKMAAQQRRLCVVGQSGLLGAGAGIALTEDGGKPKIMINKSALTASGVSLPDMIFKVSQ